MKRSVVSLCMALLASLLMAASANATYTISVKNDSACEIQVNGTVIGFLGAGVIPPVGLYPKSSGTMTTYDYRCPCMIDVYVFPARGCKAGNTFLPWKACIAPFCWNSNVTVTGDRDGVKVSPWPF